MAEENSDLHTADSAEQWLRSQGKILPLEFTPLGPEPADTIFRIHLDKIRELPYDDKNIFYRVARTLGYPLQFTYGRRINDFEPADKSWVGGLKKLLEHKGDELDPGWRMKHEKEYPIHVYVNSEAIYDQLKTLYWLSERGGRSNITIALLWGEATRPLREELPRTHYLVGGLFYLGDAADRIERGEINGSKAVLEVIKKCYVQLYEKEAKVYKNQDPVGYADSLIARQRAKPTRAPANTPFWMRNDRDAAEAEFYLRFRSKESLKPVTPEEYGMLLMDDINNRILPRRPELRLTSQELVE